MARRACEPPFPAQYPGRARNARLAILPLFGNTLPMAPFNRRVVILAYDGLCTFEFALAVEIFALPRPELGIPWYTFAVCAVDRGPLRASGGVHRPGAPRAARDRAR